MLLALRRVPTPSPRATGATVTHCRWAVSKAHLTGKALIDVDTKTKSGYADGLPGPGTDEMAQVTPRICYVERNG